MEDKIQGIEPASGVGKKFWLTLGFLALIGLFVYCSIEVIDPNEVGSKPDVEEEVSGADYTALAPGYHFLDKWPFFTIVDARHIKYARATKWTYIISDNIPEIHIPTGHKGIVKDIRRETEMQILEPGIYFVNPDLYNVELKKD